MKKILSLLVLLVTTLSAFALDFTDYRKVTLGSNTPTESNDAKLSITDNGDGTYNVTFNDIINKDGSYTDKYGTFVFSNVSGSQTGDFTTVTGTQLTGTVTGGDYGLKSFTGGELLVKFKEGKAYATMTAKCKVFYSDYTFDVVFGTDEGFGGGSTGGGEDKPAAFEKVNFVGDGTNFNWSIPVDWNTQKIVMSISTATCTTGCEHIIGLGTDGTSWGGNLHMYRTSNDQQLQCYFGAGAINTGKFPEGNPIKVEISKANGLVVDGTTRITAAQLADLFAMSTVVMGTGEGSNILSHATYNYVKVVDKDWTEPTEPEVTVVATKKFNDVDYSNTWSQAGTANVTFEEMSDETVKMKFTTDGINISADALKKDTDDKGRTTYTGIAFNDAMSSLEYTIKAVVYTEGTEEKLYMTMEASSGVTFTVGVDPDAPKVVATVPFTGVTLSVSNGVTGTADVTFKEMSDETVQMTFNGAGYGISATNLTKGTDAKGRTTYTGEAVSDAASTTTYSVSAVVYGEATAQKLYMTMVSVDGTTFTVGEDPDPVAPETPKDVTVVEKYQADGTGFSHTINVDWDKQKIVASIDFSNGGDDKDILAMTTGKSFSAFQTSTYRTMHWYCNQTAKQMSGFFAKSGADNNNTGRIDVADCLAKFEISKAEGLKVNGVVKMTPTALEELLTGAPIIIGSGESPKFSNAFYNYIKVVSLDWKEPTEPEVTVKDEKTFNEALYMQDQKVADATVVVKEMSDETINMSLKFGENEYTSTELTKGTDEKNRTTYTGKVANGTQTYDVKAVVYEKDNVARLYMTLATSVTTVVVGENPDVVTPEVTEVSNKTYTSNLRILDGETTVVEEAEANVNIIKYSDESYKVTLKDVNILNKTQDLVFVGSAIVEEGPAEGAQPLTIMAKSDEATTTVFGEQVSGTFEITEVSADEIKMGFSMESQNFSYMGEFNYTEEEEPEVYTNNLHIYDAAAPETDLFQADQAKVEFLATATGEFKLTLKDVTLNENTQDLVFTGMLSAPEPGGQDPLAEEGETTPAEPAMVLNAIADEATATFLGATSATAVFNVIMNDEAETENDAFALTFAITAGEKTLGGEFNYEKTPDVEEYPINFDKTAKSTHNSRALNSFSLQQTGKDKQTESVYASKAAYEDHTSKVFTVEAGSELTASFDYTGEWMHSFVYIDFDNDGQFSYKEGQWDQTGTDLVAFSFYSLDSNPKNDASGYNSVGDELTGDARNTYVAPSFKAPAKAGEYRIRFKFDWNCILPGGSSSILSDGGGVWDATLKVVEPVVDGISSINAEVANGETQLFTVDGVKLNKLQKGLNIVRTADGKVKKVLVK